MLHSKRLDDIITYMRRFIIVLVLPVILAVSGLFPRNTADAAENFGTIIGDVEISESETDETFAFALSFSDVSVSSASAIVALYDKSAKLVAVKSKDISVSGNTQMISITVSKVAYDHYNIFVWNSPDGMQTSSAKKSGKPYKIEELQPFASGFISEPVYCYTAYYDVDFHIEKMYAEFNGNGVWNELSADNYDSFTDNACIIQLPTELNGQPPAVRIKAYYTDKITKITGDPKITLEGYRIKAELNGYTEYFTPQATIPFALINSSESVPLNNYIKFERASASGIKEEFYLVLRPKSTSKFTINGLSPTDFNKIFTASQDRSRQIYRRLSSYYTMNNNASAIKFVDGTDKDIPNYTKWRQILIDSIDTFNECLGNAGINAHIEEVSSKESNNYILYGSVPNDYAGLTEYVSENNYFRIWINGNTNMLSTDAKIKSSIVHEMGHLLGFNDSAYAVDDSVYSYGRNNDKITYFQPNDIATMKFWMK